MADSADDGRDAGIDGAGHGFFVEAPQVFQRAAAAGQDQCIKAPCIGQLERPDDLRRGFAALYGGGDQGQFDLRRPAAEHADDVANHGPGGRADNADALRVSGQGDLALGAEQAFGAEFFLQRIEGQAQRAVAGGFHGIEDQLVIATAFKQRDLAAHLDRQAVLERLTHPCCVVAKQCATHLGAAVLEGEVHMARGRAGEVGDFAFYPDIAEYVFEQHPRPAIELADGQDFPVEIESCKGVFNHAGHHKGGLLSLHLSDRSLRT